MVSYNETAAAATLWPEPMESTWQMLPGGWEPGVGWKRPDITLSDRLFIGAVVNIPREQRPWGGITWLADVFNTSRETVYTIGRRARDGLLDPVVKLSFEVPRSSLEVPPGGCHGGDSLTLPLAPPLPPAAGGRGGVGVGKGGHPRPRCMAVRVERCTVLA